MTRRTYLDWNATAPLLPVARAAMLAALDVGGNPSSVHAEGRAARELVETAREQVAALVGARAADVVFTSGATEANTTVFASSTWGSVAVSAVEHPSVLGQRSDQPSLLIRAGTDGRAAIDADLAPLLSDREALPGRLLVSLQRANGETGVIHDVAALAALCRSHRPDAFLHSDATQAAGRLTIDLGTLGVDALTLSSHKLGGPKGVGALVLNAGRDLTPLIVGGGQERRRRAGTENVAAIAGFGAAAAAAIETLDRIDAIRARRDHLEAELTARFAGVTVIGADSPRLANTSCFAMSGKAAETLVIKYDLAGVAISAGAACTSGKVGASPVLTAMGLAADMARSAIRVSLGLTTTDDDIAAFLAASTTILSAPALAA